MKLKITMMLFVIFFEEVCQQRKADCQKRNRRSCNSNGL